MVWHAQAGEALGREDVVGVDSEWKPSFFKGKESGVALLQISSRTACYLIDMLAVAQMDSTLVDAALGYVLLTKLGYDACIRVYCVCTHSAKRVAPCPTAMKSGESQHRARHGAK
jgi:hypothetical protein